MLLSQADRAGQNVVAFRLDLSLFVPISRLEERPSMLSACSETTLRMEDVMNDVRFPEPVTLRILSMSRNVATSFEALECLEQQWPERARGRSWRAAARACRDALDGWRSARDARKAFLKAATRAGLMPSAAPLGRKPRPIRIIDSLRPELRLGG